LPRTHAMGEGTLAACCQLMEKPAGSGASVQFAAGDRLACAGIAVPSIAVAAMPMMTAARALAGLKRLTSGPSLSQQSGDRGEELIRRDRLGQIGIGQFA
jgi:hypothetical protein